MTATADMPQDATAALWRRNWPLVQLVGLTPLLVVTTSVVKGLALGVLTTLVLLAANTLTATFSAALLPRARPLFYLLVAATTVTCLDWLVHATFYDLHAALGIFLPLIVANGGVLIEADSFTEPRSMGHAVTGAFSAGLGFTAVLAVLGAVRELLGQGTLFSDLPLVGADGASWLRLSLPFDGALVALLPPGGLLAMGALLALRNRQAERSGP